MKVWRLLAEYDAETTTTFSACAGTPASPWTSDFNGWLTGIRVIVSQAAATSLIEFQQFRLTCAAWSPNLMEIGCAGNGLMTAPACMRQTFDFEVYQPVISGTPVQIEGRNITAATPVGVETFILGQFEVAQRL